MGSRYYGGSNFTFQTKQNPTEIDIKKGVRLEGNQISIGFRNNGGTRVVGGGGAHTNTGDQEIPGQLAGSTVLLFIV